MKSQSENAADLSSYPVIIEWAVDVEPRSFLLFLTDSDCSTGQYTNILKTPLILQFCSHICQHNYLSE